MSHPYYPRLFGDPTPLATEKANGDGLLGGEVIAELPQRLFRLRLDDDTTIIAGPGTEAKRLGIPINVGMRVTIRRASLDPARGTILGPCSSHPLDPTSSSRKPAP